MFLFLNSIVASLDGLIIGIGLRLAHIKITKQNILFILIGNLIIYSTILYLYYAFHLKFITKNIATIFYLLLAFNAYKEEKETTYTHKLTLVDCIFLTLTHSVDGTLVSLNFIYNYNIFFITSLFSFMSLAILLLGYYFARIFQKMKKSNLISALLFILLAMINQFF